MLYRIVFALLATTHLSAQHDRLTASKAARDALHHMDPTLKTVFEYHCFGTKTRPSVALHATLHLYDKTADRHSHHVQQQAEKYTREHLLAPGQKENRCLYAYCTMPHALIQDLTAPYEHATIQNLIHILSQGHNSWDNDTTDLHQLTQQVMRWTHKFIEDRDRRDALRHAHHRNNHAQQPRVYYGRHSLNCG